MSKKIKLPRKRKKAFIKVYNSRHYWLRVWINRTLHSANPHKVRNTRFYEFTYDETPGISVEDHYKSEKIVKRY